MMDNKTIANAMYAVSTTPNANATTNPRLAVLISMAYQMGVVGLSNFRNMLLAVQSHDWFQAETQMLKSRWASQTPNRARRHATQMRTGTWCTEYK